MVSKRWIPPIDHNEPLFEEPRRAWNLEIEIYLKQQAEQERRENLRLEKASRDQELKD